MQRLKLPIILTVFAWCVYAMSFAYATVISSLYPYHNWDMVPYIACILHWQYDDMQTVYDQTMALAKGAYRPGLFNRHILHMQYSDSPQHLENILPFYQVKPLYLWLIWLFNAAGIGLVRATSVVSQVSYLALGVVLALWRPSMANHSLWLCCIVVLSFFGWHYFSMIGMAGCSTPDALQLMLCMLALIDWLNWRSPVRFCLWGILAILARSDALLFLGILCVYFSCFSHEEQSISKRYGFAVLAIFVMTYIAVQKFCGAYGWEVLFRHTLLDPSPDVADMQITFDQYWRALLRGGAQEILKFRTQFFLILPVIITICHVRFPDHQRSWLWLLWFMWAGMIAHFALLPAVANDRYLYPYYLTITMASLELSAPALSAMRNAIRRNAPA